MVSRCFYGRAIETSRHLFIDCPQVSQIWDYFQCCLGLRRLSFLSSHALFFHMQQYASSRTHFWVLLPCLILWHVLKARNDFKFASQPFSINAVIFLVVSNLRLASSAFGFKLSQLQGVTGSQLTEGLYVVTSRKRLVGLVSWM